jgi:hypothetical protein
MAPPTLSTPVAVMMILSLLLGVLTHIVQTGSLGPSVVPQAWLPYFTIATTFLGGFVAYLSGLTPLVIDGASVFYAVAAGVTSLLASSAPSFAVHAHVTIPRQLASWKAADAITNPGEGK